MKNMKQKTHKATFADTFKSLPIRIGLFLFSIAIFYHTVFAIRGFTEPIDVIWFIIVIPILFLSCFKQIKSKFFYIELFLLSVLAIISYFSSQLYVVIIPILACLIILWIYSLKYLSFSTTKKTLFVISNLLIVCSTYIFLLGYNPIALYGYKVYEPERLHYAWNSLPVLKNKKYGVVDALTGKEIIPLQFDSIDIKNNLFSINIDLEKEIIIKKIIGDNKGSVYYNDSINKLYLMYQFHSPVFDDLMQKREIEYYISTKYDSLDLEIRKQFRQLYLNWTNNFVNQVTGGDPISYKSKCDSILFSLDSLLLKSNTLVIKNINDKINSVISLNHKNFGVRDLTELKHSIIQTIIYIRLKECLTSNETDKYLMNLFNISNLIVAYNDKNVKPGFITNNTNINLQINDSIIEFKEFRSFKITSYDIVNRIHNKYNNLFYLSTSLFFTEDKLQDALNHILTTNRSLVKLALENIHKTDSIIKNKNSFNELSTEELYQNLDVLMKHLNLVDNLKSNVVKPFSEKPETELEKLLFYNIFTLLEQIIKNDDLISYHSDAILIYERLLYCKFFRNMDFTNNLQILNSFYNGEYSNTTRLNGIINETYNQFEKLIELINQF